jgi:acyl-CoA dehydrogenase
VPEEADMLRETATRVFADHFAPRDLAAAEAGAWPTAGWEAVENAGLTRALVPEEAGGYGVDPAEALSILRAAGGAAVPLPLAETMMASWLLAQAGLAIPDGTMSVAPVLPGDSLTATREGDGWRISGTAGRVPWGRSVDAMAVLTEGPDGMLVARLPAGSWTVTTSANLAREPRDTVTFDTLVPRDAVGATLVEAAQLHRLGAAARCQQMSGAMDHIMALTVQYALDRKQFGKPIGKFQAVQQNLAIMASQTAAASAAADLAAEAVGLGMGATAIGAAKLRCGEAAGTVASLSHAVHGAIGFTYEHSLHYFTKRLWSWRDEFGGETEWARALGRMVAERGPDHFWSDMTSV